MKLYICIYLIAAVIFGTARFIKLVRIIRKKEAGGEFIPGIGHPVSNGYLSRTYLFAMAASPIGLLAFIMKTLLRSIGVKPKPKRISPEKLNGLMGMVRDYLKQNPAPPQTFSTGPAYSPMYASVPIGCCIYCSKGVTEGNPFLVRLNRGEKMDHLYQHWDLSTKKGCAANMLNISPWGDIENVPAKEGTNI